MGGTMLFLMPLRMWSRLDLLTRNSTKTRANDSDEYGFFDLCLVFDIKASSFFSVFWTILVVVFNKIFDDRNQIE
jgi:hypothetical protein